MDMSSIMRQYTRHLLVIFNFLFALTGIFIISIGLTVKAYYHEYGSFLNDRYLYASDLLIVVGVVIFFIAFFGCCGALKENVCMTTTFSSLLIVVFVLEILVGIGGVLLKNKTEDVVRQTLTKSMLEYNKDNSTLEITQLWDKVQTTFHCCGVTNYTDWETQTNTTQHKLPMSCCDIPSGSVDTLTCHPDSLLRHKEGCLEVFSDYIKGHATTIEGVGLGLAIIQLLGIMLSCYLAKKIRQDYETV